MKSFLVFLILVGCTSTQHMASLQEMSPRKMKQKISLLEKKLRRVRDEDEKTKSEISELIQEIYLTQLTLIENEVAESEKKLDRFYRPIDTAALFLKEREILHEIIQQGTLSMTQHAEALLDRILRIITVLSDNF